MAAWRVALRKRDKVAIGWQGSYWSAKAGANLREVVASFALPLRIIPLKILKRNNQKSRFRERSKNGRAWLPTRVAIVQLDLG